ncbi:MAG: helix-turn-helix transcriptional regulator [Streptosporangiaceae bacterium]
MAPKSTRTDNLLTIRELAALLHVEPQTIHYWRHRGTAPQAVRPNGGKLLFRQSDVDAWLEKQSDRAGTS